MYGQWARCKTTNYSNTSLYFIHIKYILIKELHTFIFELRTYTYIKYLNTYQRTTYVHIYIFLKI